MAKTTSAQPVVASIPHPAQGRIFYIAISLGEELTKGGIVIPEKVAEYKASGGALTSDARNKSNYGVVVTCAEPASRTSFEPWPHPADRFTLPAGTIILLAQANEWSGGGEGSDQFWLQHQDLLGWWLPGTIPFKKDAAFWAEKRREAIALANKRVTVEG